MDFAGGSAGRESACNAGDLSSIPGLERSPGEGNSYSLQYSGLENSTGVAKSWTQQRFSHTQWCGTGVGGWREVQKGGEICIPLADSC